MTESWRPIEDFPNYEVSNQGRVRNIQRGGRVLKGYKVGYGKPYMQVDLFRGRVLKPFKIHRLVVMAFIGPIPSHLEVNHIDGDKMNNCVSNLEIVTKSENIRHAYATGLVHGKTLRLDYTVR